MIFFWVILAIILEPFDFHLPFTGSVGLIPVQFSFTDMAALKPHFRKSFKFAPAPTTEGF
jgi:hypothetical protein